MEHSLCVTAIGTRYAYSCNTYHGTKCLPCWVPGTPTALKTRNEEGNLLQIPSSSTAGHRWPKNIDWIDADNWWTVKISIRLIIIRRKKNLKLMVRYYWQKIFWMTDDQYCQSKKYIYINLTDGLIPSILIHHLTNFKFCKHFLTLKKCKYSSMLTYVRKLN